MAFVSFCASPFSNACSLNSAFTVLFCLYGYVFKSNPSNPQKKFFNFFLKLWVTFYHCSVLIENLLTKKLKKMKKVFALLAIAGFVACNNGETKTEAVDSTKIQDSLAKAAAAVDTTKKAADTTKPAATADTTKK